MANLNDVLITPDSLVDDWIKEDRKDWGRYEDKADNYVSIYNSVHELPTLDEFLLEISSVLNIGEDEKDRLKDILNTKAEAAWADGLKGEERIERGINEYIEELEKEYPIEENQKDSLKTRFRDIANRILDLLGKTYANVGFIKYNIVNGNNYVKLLKLFENIRDNNKEELREYKKLEDGENASISDHEDMYQLWNFGNTILEIYCWINLHRKDTFLFNGKIKLKYFIENYEEPKNFNDYFDELVNAYKRFINEEYKDFYLDEKINSFNNLPDDLSEEEKKRVLKHLEVDQLSQYIHEDLPTYWKVSPGENAKYWEEFKENNVIGIGWIKDTNLDEIDLDSELEEVLKNKDHDAKGQNKGQIKRFVEGINRGDYIIANKGQHKILGIGKVTSDYKYNNSITYPHTREVDWLWTGEQKISKQDGWRLTVQKPLDYETIKEIKEPINGNFFWLGISPQKEYQKLKEENEFFFPAFSKEGNKRNAYKFIKEAESGDKVLIFASSPKSKVVGIGEIKKGLHEEHPDGYDEPVKGFSVKKIREIEPIEWKRLKDLNKFKESNAVESNGRPQGGLIKISKKAFEEVIEEIDGKKYFWMAIDTEEDYKNLKNSNEYFYPAYTKDGNKRQSYRYFKEAKTGDKVLFYISANWSQVVGVGEITKELDEEELEEYNGTIEGVSVKHVQDLKRISWKKIRELPKVKNSNITMEHDKPKGGLVKIQKEVYKKITGPLPPDDPSYFWVNQKHEEEIEEEYLEALVDDDWRHDLSKLSQGDIVLNYYNGELVGYSEVLEDPKTIKKNGEDKYRVDIELNKFDSRVTKDDYIDYLMKDEVRTDKYYPLDKNGVVNEGYLFELSNKAGEFLVNLPKKGMDEIKEEVFLNDNDAKNAKKEFVKLFRYLDDLENIKSVINTTYDKNRNKISVNLGNWQIYSIEKSGNEYVAQFSVETKLLPDDYDEWSFLKKEFGEFDKGEGIRLIRVYWNKDLLDNNPRLEDAWRSSAKLGKNVFSDWSKSPYNKYHNEEIYDWIIDGFPKPKKETLLDLNNGELVFEGLDVTDGLYFPRGMKKEINQSIKVALSSGKHIIFTGPPGTGKTKIAKNTAEHLDNTCDCVDGYIFTTATADWTTFDTIGGYHPEKESSGLKFKAGQFLKCFKDDEGTPVNKWLIIDEINRADIDKAFGQLFSTLSNDKVELPFTNESNKTISLIPLESSINDFDYSEENYYMTSNWRLLGTMNTYDKASLYEMSYAFMRRFAFIDVSVPTENIDAELISKYVEVWDGLSLKDVGEYVGSVSELWKTLNEGKRAIGPAIIKDILLFLKESENLGLVNALKLYVLPQLEGMVKQDQKQLIKDLGDVIEEEEELYRVAEERFEIDKEELENE